VLSVENGICDGIALDNLLVLALLLPALLLLALLFTILLLIRHLEGPLRGRLLSSIALGFQSRGESLLLLDEHHHEAAGALLNGNGTLADFGLLAGLAALAGARAGLAVGAPAS
jgi:hypothetical protein